MDKFCLLFFLYLFTLARSNQTSHTSKLVTLSISVEQGDTYSINPEDHQLYDFFRGRLVSGADFINVAPVGSLEDYLRNGTQLNTRHGLVEHIAVHPNQQYVYFFHKNISGSIYNYVELFQISDLLTSSEPKFIRAAEFNLRTHLFPDRTYNYNYLRDQYILLSSTADRKMALMNVTSPAGITQVAEITFPSGATLEHGYFDLYLNFIIIPVNHNSLSFTSIDMQTSPIMAHEVKRFDFSTSSFLLNKGLDINTVVVTDVTVDGGHSLLYAVIEGQGIAVVSLATFQLNQEVEIIYFEPVPNLREIETNPYNRRILVCTAVPSTSTQGDVLEFESSGSNSTDFQMSVRFNNTNVFTARTSSSTPSHTLYSSPEIATVDARYSLQVASNLPSGMKITTMSSTSELAVALIHNLNNTWMILAETYGSSPNSQDINLYSIEFNRYVVWIDPGNRYLGNFNAVVELDGATCDFDQTGLQQHRPTADSYCTLQMGLRIEVKGYALSRTDGVVIGILVAVLVGVGICVGVIVGRYCAAKRKIKKEKYKRGIPDEIELDLENDEMVFTKGFTFSDSKDLFKVDEAPPNEETTPSKKVVFEDVKQEDQNTESSGNTQEEEEEKTEESQQENESQEVEQIPEQSISNDNAEKSEVESPIKPRNLSFETPESKQRGSNE